MECLAENIKPLTLNLSMFLLYVTRRLHKPLNLWWRQSSLSAIEGIDNLLHFLLMNSYIISNFLLRHPSLCPAFPPNYRHAGKSIASIWTIWSFTVVVCSVITRNHVEFLASWLLSQPTGTIRWKIKLFSLPVNKTAGRSSPFKSCLISFLCPTLNSYLNPQFPSNEWSGS